MRSARTGIVLILVSALLTLLVLLSVALTLASRSGRGRTRASVLQARAALLARSGVERAVQAVGRNPVPRPARDRSDDWTDLDPPGTRLEDARNPSLHHPRLEPWLDDGDGIWEGEGFTDRNGNGRYDGVSGRLRGAHDTDGDTYVVRVEDESAKINLNGGLLDGLDRDADVPPTPDHRDLSVGPPAVTATETGLGWNAQLRRILDILGNAREDADGNGALGAGEDWDGDGTLDPAPIGVADLGRILIEARPPGGYASVEDAEAVVAAAAGRTVDLSPYLTVSSWVDVSVVRPNAYQAQIVPGAYGALADVKRLRPALRPEAGGRPPVNLNAASRPVLLALLSGLEGVSWYDEYHPVRYALDGWWANRVAERIVASRPFATWAAFDAFCDGLVPGTLGGFTASADQASWGGGNLCAADLLKANFDPNTRLNKQHADQIAWRWIDKSDLLVWSTEGNLGSTGTYTIRSMGQVAEGRGGVSARAYARTDLQCFRPVRQTTQAEFVSSRGDPRDYLSRATGVERTTGASASWLGGGTGLAAVTYPNPPTALPADAADFDGAVALATVETPATPPAGGALLFLHHFDDGWDADSGADPGRKPGNWDGRLQADPSVGVWPTAAQPPGTLYPDGMHAQEWRNPAYVAWDHLPEMGRHGAVGYWLKDKPYQSVNMMRYTMHFTCIRLGGGASEYSHTLLTGRRWEARGILCESAVASAGADAGAEQKAGAQYVANAVRRPGFRWHLVTALWDTDETVQGESAVGTCRGIEGSGSGAGSYANPYDPALAQDLFSDNTAVFAIGGWKLPPAHHAANYVLHSDQVVDEFAICDFGDLSPAARNAAEQWAGLRYAEGRYYKGNDATFTSGTLDAGNGAPVRIVGASWTGILPSETRQEFVTSSAIPASASPRVLDADLSGARIEVELLDAAGDPLSPRRWIPESGPVGVRTGPFRYRVALQPTPTWDALDAVAGDPAGTKRDNTPVLETPFFDDITFYVQSASGPRFLSWRGD